VHSRGENESEERLLFIPLMRANVLCFNFTREMLMCHRSERQADREGGKRKRTPHTTGRSDAHERGFLVRVG